MKVIIAGSRTVVHAELITAAIKESKFMITEVVSGHGGSVQVVKTDTGFENKIKGADLLGEEWARANGKQVTLFPADWGRHGKKAGPFRNFQMAEYADALIAIWDEQSRGTCHMIEAMRSRRKMVFIKKFKFHIADSQG